MPTPTPNQERFLRAVLDRLIPRDDFPSATEVGVDKYILRQLQCDLAPEASSFWIALDLLEAETGVHSGIPFTSLEGNEQDQLLSGWERDDRHAIFFKHLVNLAAEGYYSDPGNGGNFGAASWNMIGYDPRRPLRVSAP